MLHSTLLPVVAPLALTYLLLSTFTQFTARFSSSLAGRESGMITTSESLVSVTFFSASSSLAGAGVAVAVCARKLPDANTSIEKRNNLKYVVDIIVLKAFKALLL